MGVMSKLRAPAIREVAAYDTASIENDDLVSCLGSGRHVGPRSSREGPDLLSELAKDHDVQRTLVHEREPAIPLVRLVTDQARDRPVVNAS